MTVSQSNFSLSVSGTFPSLREVEVVDENGRINQGFSAFTKLGPRNLGTTVAQFFENRKNDNTLKEDRLRVINTIRGWNIEFRERFVLGVHDVSVDEATLLQKALRV